MLQEKPLIKKFEANQVLFSKNEGHLFGLDMFRGFAAILMIINHSGNELLKNTVNISPIAISLVFLGSFAPVLFFLTTGFGIALSKKSEEIKKNLFSTAWKGLLLIFADQLFCWNDGTPLRLDFFSFIAISTILLTFLSRFNRALMIAVISLVVIVLVRYGVAPKLEHMDSLGSITHWMLGAPGTQDISYPFSPWMVYPLIGFITAKVYFNNNSNYGVKSHKLYTMGFLMFIITGALAVILYSKGFVFFRWGTVSFAYFVSSLSVVTLVGLISFAISAKQNVYANFISLKGTASFLVIPFHYGIIYCFKQNIPPIESSFAFIGVTALIISVAIVWAKLTEQLIKWIYSLSGQFYIGIISIFTVVISYALSLQMNHTTETDFSALAILFSQITIGGLLLYRFPQRTPKS